MNRSEWQEKHRRECYLPAAQNYLERTLEYVLLHENEIHKELTGQVDAFLQSLCLLQEMGKLGAVQTICISFPYTSLVCGSPSFLFEVYPQEPFLHDPMVMREFPVSWMFHGWEEFLEQLKSETGKCGMNAVIRPTYLKGEGLRAARMIVTLMASLIKAHLYGLGDTEAYRKLNKAENFVLSFGEYYDWQKTILAERGQIDIFQCEEEEDLRFCRFHQAWYEKKEFRQLVLDDCQFVECTFTDTFFFQTSFKDARFLGCVFKNCELSGVDLHGARMDGCVFENVTFGGVRTNSLAPGMERIMGIQGRAEFISTSLEEVMMKNCDLSAAAFRDCRMKGVKTKDCILPEDFSHRMEDEG